MGIRGGRGFVGETLWRPIATAMALFVGLVSVSAAIGVGGSWTFGIKVLVVVALLLLILLIFVLYVAYLLYKKIDRPLNVRKVSKGTHYYENNVMVPWSEVIMFLSAMSLLCLYVKGMWRHLFAYYQLR